MPRVEGTERTRTLIGNVVRDLHRRKPPERHVDYSISAGSGSELFTSEQGDTFRNVSRIYLPKIQATIGNKTGTILVRKPWCMSTKEAVRRICAFLEAIQPDRLSTAITVSAKANVLHNSNEPEFNRSRVSYILRIGWEKITRTVIGSNSSWTDGEVVKVYTTL